MRGRVSGKGIDIRLDRSITTSERWTVIDAALRDVTVQPPTPVFQDC